MYFVVTTRMPKNKEFGASIGVTRYLKISSQQYKKSLQENGESRKFPTTEHAESFVDWIHEIENEVNNVIASYKKMRYSDLCVWI